MLYAFVWGKNSNFKEGYDSRKHRKTDCFYYIYIKKIGTHSLDTNPMLIHLIIPGCLGVD